MASEPMKQPRSLKEEVAEVLRQLPDDLTLEELLYQIDFRLAVRRGMAEADRGEVVTQEEVEKQMSSWLKSAGR